MQRERGRDSEIKGERCRERERKREKEREREKGADRVTER